MGCGAAIGAIAAVASAGVGAASAAGAFSPGSPNYGAITKDQITAEIQNLPQSYAAQQEYNPRFAAINNVIAYNNLFGTKGSPGTADQQMPAGWYNNAGDLVSSDFLSGLINSQKTGATWSDGYTKKGTVGTPASKGQLDLLEQATPRLIALGNQENTAARTATINDVATLGPKAYAAMHDYDKTASGILDSADAQVQTRLNSPGLDPFQERALQQNFRAAEAARGLAGGTSDAAMESYYLTSNADQRQLQNIQLADQQVGVDRAYYGDPFQQVVARSSGSTAAIPNVNTTANQPSAVAQVGQSITPGMNQLASQGYNAQLQGQQQQLSSLNGILSPASASSLSGAYKTLSGYF